MKTGLLLVALLLSGVRLQAITWEFDEEEIAQGWSVWAAANSGEWVDWLPKLRSEVRDGFWRVFPMTFAMASEQMRIPQTPAFEIVSPQIGHDSALFDRIVLRFRLVHDQPLKGSMRLSWTNTRNQNSPGNPTTDMLEGIFTNPALPAYEIHRLNQVFTGEWQEVVFEDLRSRPEEYPWARGFVRDLWWEGELIDFHLDIGMSMDTDKRPGAWPEALEIDRIVLTGVEEQIQGELPPPPTARDLPRGQWFAPPVFSPLEHGAGFASGPGNVSALGDVDGDAKADLVTSWFVEGERGWVTVRNEGNGRFGPVRRQAIFPAKRGDDLKISGADFDGDGRLDLVVQKVVENEATDGGFQVLHNDAEEGWIVTRELLDPGFLDVIDGNGDGHMDLLFRRRSTDAELYLNDGAGQFVQEPLIFPLSSQGLEPFGLAHYLPPGTMTGVLWAWGDQVAKVSYLNASGEVVEVALTVDLPYQQIRYAGDIDGDGDVDLIACEEEYLQRYRSSGKGLLFLRNQGDGSFEQLSWLPEVITANSRQQVLFLDLNGDAYLDPVVMDANERQQVVQVFFGKGEGVPVLEGSYPFPGVAGDVLSGDVDGDGEVDLVMVDGTRDGEGVYVFLNQGIAQSTAVSEGQRTPVQFRLEQNYPNPFNPQTWIPFEIPEEGGPVDLRIYNVLGHPIRTLVAGRLTPGRHLVPWDGIDDRGESVSSGVYLYHLQVGNWRAAGRMTRSR